MTEDICDIFNHCLPPEYVAACRDHFGEPNVMFERALELPGMCDIEERIKIVNQFDGYSQILSLASPAPEAIAAPGASAELVRGANDSLAAWCVRHPKHFPGFIASLPMNQPEAVMNEARRARDELGAVGVQIYTHVNGTPLDAPPILAVIESLAAEDFTIWLHPLRGANSPDYPDESVSKFDLWWAFGWPHETSICCGRLVFSGLFERRPKLRIITHHAGGTIPLIEGRIENGLGADGEEYRSADSQTRALRLREKPIDSFRRFYADTATFGSRLAVDAAVHFFGEERMLFASDFPFASIKASLAAAEGISRATLVENTNRLLQA